MKKKFFAALILCLIFFQEGNAQHKKRDPYLFINQIGEQWKIGIGAKTYLVEELFPTIIYVDLYKKEIYDSLTKYFEKVEIDKIIELEKKDVKNFKWKSGKISFTQLISEKEKQQIVETNRSDNLVFYYCTLPRFSKEGNHAVILVSTSGGNGGSTCLMIYSLINEKWVLEKKVLCSMS